VGPKVGIDHRDELGAGPCQSCGEGAGLEARPRAPPDVLDLGARPAQTRDLDGGKGARLVVAVVQELDGEAIARPVECRRGIEGAGDGAELVVNGKLDDD
jgi:hypothetical protein